MHVLDYEGLRKVAQSINKREDALKQDMSALDDLVSITGQKVTDMEEQTQTTADLAGELAVRTEKHSSRLSTIEAELADVTDTATTAGNIATAARTTAANALTNANNALDRIKDITATVVTLTEASDSTDTRIALLTDSLRELQLTCADLSHTHFLPFAEFVSYSGTVATLGVGDNTDYDVVYDTNSKQFLARIRANVSRIVGGPDTDTSAIYAKGVCMERYNTDQGEGTPYPQQLYMGPGNRLWCFSDGELVRVDTY